MICTNDNEIKLKQNELDCFKNIEIYVRY